MSHHISRATLLENELFSDSIRLQLPIESDETKEFLAVIRVAFGFTTKDLADVLRVERQTIYAWVRGENEPTSENAYRIRLLTNWAEEWNTLSKLPAKKLLRIQWENGTSLLEELCRETHDFDTIHSMLLHVSKLIRELEELKRIKQNRKTSVRNSEYGMVARSAFIPKEAE